MNINPTESTIELTKLSPPQILFGIELDEKSSSEQFLLSIYDSVQASIFVVDVLEDGDFQYVALNPTHERWIGIRSDDLQGKKPEDILSAIDAAKVRQRYADCVLFGKTISYEQCLQFQGIPTWWSTTLTPLRDANSRIYRLIGTSSNITPVQQAEQAVGLQVEREQLLEAIAGQIHESVELETILHQTTIELRQQIKDLKAKLELQKQKHKNQLQQVRNFEALVRRMTEQIRDSLDETQVLQTVTQELAELLNLDRCQIELYSTCETLVTITYEYSINLPQCQGLTRQIADRLEVYQPLLQKQPLQFLEMMPGWQPKLLVMSQMACPIFDTQGILGNIWLTRPSQEAFDEFEIELVQQVANECAIAIRQAQLYKQTQAQVKELEKRDRLKNQFLRTLSQELRTPITSISLAAQTLESVLTPAEISEIEIVPQLLQILHKECGRESKLINDLLTLTYLEAEPDPPTLIAIDLQSWLHPIIESFRDLTNCQRQQLNLKVDHDLPLLETDITDLERIVTELLNHACKYTPPGESITVSAHLIGDAVELNITNSGIELTSNELSQIFEPFYHLDKHDPWKHSGTGLELALVQKMVRHLGGSIYVESAAGQTTFTVKFSL
ncbi:PAS domain-containing protein [Nostoc sp. CHAB 5836]|uniref:PAS domain-containing sensor histidine kinase n=1 Tax=Nostoc sp. CHAB 5836 TaxID=2780404 RepID=UPI001E3497B6|nr:PAS domain-containing sensor histidine kinase [Nostoc sp. CHAB 5836]MCC5618679.1 PAS domain-containing protein [Nostoc sp. CHAB 5836]